MTQPTPEQRAAAEEVWARRKQRALDLIKPAAPAEGAGDDEPTPSFEEFRALCEAPDVQQKAAEIKAAARQPMEQAPGSPRHAPASRPGGIPRRPAGRDRIRSPGLAGSDAPAAPRAGPPPIDGAAVSPALRASVRRAGHGGRQ
ncbi:hypothetical protein [Streptomyces sp. CL12-4]|uniref:hypothetical protein n=1 Tax=Streptomyces sp. CL12-4 TaxID=2810306 RepID=UPI001EFA8B0F|nr:hypothetical protein [Streptomyces sp. CL12-4]MCG8970260.1 hypothetical protein [Streptomyces sp. CL12-4]